MNTKAIFIYFMMIVLFTGCGGTSLEVSGSNSAIERQFRELRSGPDELGGISLDDSAVIVTDMVVDVFVKPDIKSDRIAQILYNQAVKLLNENDGWSEIAAADGVTGWVRSKFLDSDISSISGRTYSHRIIITGKDKSIYSDPTGGITVKATVMGTVLFAFKNINNAYEVYLPGNITGWVRGSGIIHVGLDADIPVTSGKDFAASALKFKGTSYLLNGLSSMGIDSQGMIYMCSKVNGLDMPRNLQEQMEVGREIGLDELEIGDIIFLGEKDDKNTIASAGIYLGNGEYIHASRNSGYVRLDGLNERGIDGKPVSARRIF